MLIQDPEAGGKIKSLAFVNPSIKAEDQYELLQFKGDHSYETLPPAQQDEFIRDRQLYMKEYLFSSLVNLETLIVEYPYHMMFPFVAR